MKRSNLRALQSMLKSHYQEGGYNRDADVLIRRTAEKHEKEIEVEKQLQEGAYGRICSVSLKGSSSPKVSGLSLAAKIIEVKEPKGSVDEKASVLPEEYEMIIKELRTLKTLQSPENDYIVKLYSAYHVQYEKKAEVWLLMELLPRDLFDIVEPRHMVLTLREIAVIVRRIILALEFVHSKGLIHRDLKLENILLSSDGRLKLCDFGFTEKQTDELIVTERMNGTVEVMAPELFIKGHAYDKSVDIWSLGVVAYMLTLRSYFDYMKLHKSGSFGIMNGERGFQKKLWDEYRRNDEAYFATVMDLGCLDYEEVGYENVITMLKNPQLHPHKEYYTCRSRQYRRVFDFCMRALAPYPQTGPDGLVKRRNYLKRASLEQLKEDPLCIPVSWEAEMKQRQIILGIMKRSEVAIEKEGSTLKETDTYW